MVKVADGGVAKGVEGRRRPLHRGLLGGPGWPFRGLPLCWSHKSPGYARLGFIRQSQLWRSEGQQSLLRLEFPDLSPVLGPRGR